LRERLVIRAWRVDSVGEESGQERTGEEAGVSQWRVEKRRIHVGVVAKGELVGAYEGIVFRGERRGRKGRWRDERGGDGRAVLGSKEEEGEKVRGEEEEDVEEVVLERETMGCYRLHRTQRGGGGDRELLGFRC
jgi:hypothetical protein